MKKLLLVTAALAAAVVVFTVLSLPPRAAALRRVDDGTVAGLIHVHTNRSDGLAAPDVVAAAAARAGLKFLIFTDHGDATRHPDAPQYRSGVLCLDGVEISTSGGHYIAIDMPPSPYPLAGEPRDVVEDVRRLGGFGIAAHPDSPKPQLRWIDWTAPIDGVELLNPDTSWRLLAARSGFAPKRQLLGALFAYPVRAPEVLASLIQPTHVVAEWAAAAETRRVVTIAGADAHAKLELRNSDPAENTFAMPIPGYESSFRAMSVHARLDGPLSGDAAADARALTSAIRRGRIYVAVDGLAGPPSFEFTASNANGIAEMGDEIRAADGVSLHVKSNAPDGFTTVVHEGISTLSSVANTQDLTVHGPSRPGVYWAEILSNRGEPATWIRGNPVYVRGPNAAPPPERPAELTLQPVFTGRGLDGWHVEHDSKSVGAFEIAESTAVPELRYRFGLAGGSPAGQFVALCYDLPSGVGAADRVAVTIRAERPMRVSLQLRDTTADRWQRSLYVDAIDQDRVVLLDDFMPVGSTHAARPERSEIRALMFVVDTTNTKPGTSGRVWLRAAALAARQ